ncbi:MAG: hypothetical protein SGJ27_12770 [Candidatus Melainabacteria bacterium]|nr:hypothetical protein [Candidatus Melainabacteria bacterium]
MSPRRKTLTVLATLAALAATQPCFADDSNSFVSTDEKWTQLIKDGQAALENGKAMPAIGVFKRALTQVQKVQQVDQNASNRMTAITNVKLGQAYSAKGDYSKADAAFSEAKAAYTRLSIDDPDLKSALNELSKHYKAIDTTTLPDSVTCYLKEANVSGIAVFIKEEGGDLVEISLPQKYIKPIDSKDVSKVSFNKKVSFQFLTKPNGDYQVSKIQGMQVLAKTLWVNLMDSLFKVGTKPVAEVTAGKMGVTKTVSVDIPADMFNSTKQILDNFIAAIKGQPAYAAVSTGGGGTSDGSSSSSSSAGTNSITTSGSVSGSVVPTNVKAGSNATEASSASGGDSAPASTPSVSGSSNGASSTESSSASWSDSSNRPSLPASTPSVSGSLNDDSSTASSSAPGSGASTGPSLPASTPSVSGSLNDDSSTTSSSAPGSGSSAGGSETDGSSTSVPSPNASKP